MQKTNNTTQKQKSNIGQIASDKITRAVGSWRFIIIQSILLVIWIILNVTAWVNHWDPYPFIFLNLALSFQAAYTAPIILMSENREQDRERRKTATDLATDRKAEREINELRIKIDKLEKEKIDEILNILKKQ